jgi:hypothetical protein
MMSDLFTDCTKSRYQPVHDPLRNPIRKFCRKVRHQLRNILRLVDLNVVQFQLDTEFSKTRPKTMQGSPSTAFLMMF